MAAESEFDPWSAAASVGGALIGAIGSNNAAKKQAEAAKRAQEMQRRNFLMQTQLQEPQRQLGYQAMGDLSSLYGYSQPEYTTQNQLMATATPMNSAKMAKLLKGGMSFEQLQGTGSLNAIGPKALRRLAKAGLSQDQIMQLQSGYQAPQQAPQPAAQGQAGNMSRFFASPDYQFRRDEGQRGIGNSFAARGGAASGNALKALSEFNGNLASGEFNNYTNRLFRMAGMGESATNQTAQAGNQYAQGYGQSQQAQGDARASGVLGVAGSIMGGLGGMAGAWGQQQPQQQPQPSQYGPYAGGYQLPKAPPRYTASNGPTWTSNYLAGLG
jgi:hypothetical protein